MRKVFILNVTMSVFLSLFFLNCSKVSFTEKPPAGENTQPIAPSNTQINSNVTPPAGSVKLYGVATDWLKQYYGAYYGSDPRMIIVGLKIFLKQGDPAEGNIQNKPTIASATTDSNGYFEFNSIPPGNYTLIWEVPDHYYHEDDDVGRIEVKSSNATQDISNAITVFRHGLVFRCQSQSGISMTNITATLFETLAPYSPVKLNGNPLRQVNTNSNGVFYIDTADIIPTFSSSGGLIEYKNQNGEIIGQTIIDRVNHLALSGGGYCDMF